MARISCSSVLSAGHYWKKKMHIEPIKIGSWSGPWHGVNLPKGDPKASATTTTTTKLRDKKVAPLSVTRMNGQIYKVVMDDGEYY